MNRRKTHSLHGIAWLLIVMILVSSLASPAMAGVSLSLGYRGSLIEGSSLTITWNEMDDIDHYEFSFRDLTTDSLLYDHKDVGTNTEFRIKKDLIANHSYRAWVGAIAIDSNPADIPGSHQNTMTLSIKPEVCEHNGEPYKANVQKNCKSISDSEHQVTMTYDLRCPDCDDVLESNQVSEEIEPHFPDSNGDCSLCNYKYSCSHSKKDVVIENSAYRPEDENVHIRFKTGHYICANANCSKEIEPYYYEEEEKHSFKNNTCEYCGYTKAKSLSVTAARRQQTACVGESISATATVKGGSGSFDYLWKVFCNDELVDETDYSMSANYNYVATKAGNWQFRVYVRDNVLNEEASAITSSIAVSEGACSHTKQKNKTIDTGYNKASDTRHEIITYYNVICEDCGYVLSKGNYFSEIEDHIIDASGRCVCGYAASTATCAHSDSKSEQLGSSRIEQYDEKWHKLIITYQDVCANPDCGIMLVSSREEAEMVTHSYDENGQCVCGYLLPNEDCDHAPAKTELNPKYSAVDASCHHFIVTYHYECACGQLNYDENAQSFDPHIFEGRICKLCGFENPCDHADFQNVISSVVEDDKNSDTSHFVVTTYAKTCECGAINPTPIVRTTVQCSFTKNAGVQTEHESQGHQYFDRCACGNANVNGNFKNYLSSCATCQQQYGDDALAKGNTANDTNKVKELQKLLMQNGYDLPKYGADGDFGGETVAAVEKFQKDHGLNVTGVVDDVTMQALRNGIAIEAAADEKSEQDKCNVYTDGHQYKLNRLTAHPHANLKCACGAIIEDGGIKSLTCCKCGYHEWSTPQHVGGLSYKEICMRGCGTSRNVAAPAQQVAGDKFIQNMVDDRKEISYVQDRDNVGTAPESDLSNYYIAILRNGAWTIVEPVTSHYRNSIELRNGWDRLKKIYCDIYRASDIGITYVNTVGFELNPSIGGADPTFSYAGDVPLNYISNLDNDNILRKTDVTQMANEYESAYNEWKSTYTGNSSVWLSVAYGATDKLTDYGYVFTNEALNTYSDQIGAMADAIDNMTTEDVWYEEKVALWEDVLSDMLTINYTPVKSANDAHSTLSSIGTVIDVSSCDPQIVKGMQWTAKQAGLSDYINLGDLGSQAYEKWDWGMCEAFFTLVDAYFAGSEAEAKVKKAQEALAIMVMEDEASICSLQNIIESTNNPQLIEAAENMIQDIESERDKNFGEFAENIMDSIEVGSAGFTAASDAAVKNAANHYAGAALPGLGVVGKIASGAKTVLNWGASYESAQTLMTYSVMEAELNVANALSNCDTIAATNDMVQLWYSLQINGTEAAKQFAKDYDSGLALHIDDIGLADEYSTVTSVNDLTAKLNAEAEKYKNEARDFSDYCNNNAGN